MRKMDIRSILYSKEMSPLEFNFDTLTAPSMFNFITMQDITYLNMVVSSLKLSSKINEKYKLIDDILKARGFRKVGSGTNRVVYRHYEYPKCVLKVAIDKVGLGDNPKEFKNQHLLKPFITKMFECSPCGTVAWVEYCYPITNREEFKSIAGDIFNLITNKIIGKYVLEDIGTNFFMNWALREGMGPVLLDFPYVYELDGSKLYCNHTYPELGILCCDGLIDYDDGFNSLVCTRCGKTYLAHQLEDNSINNKIRIEKDEEEIKMKVSFKRGEEVLYQSEAGVSSIDINSDSIDIIGSKIESSVKIKDKRIPKKMKRVDLEKETKNKAKEANKKAEKIATRLQDQLHRVNEDRFVQPDYSNFSIKPEHEIKQDETVVDESVNLEKEFGLKPEQPRTNHRKKEGKNPYIDQM